MEEIKYVCIMSIYDHNNGETNIIYIGTFKDKAKAEESYNVKYDEVINDLKLEYNISDDDSYINENFDFNLTIVEEQIIN